MEAVAYTGINDNAAKHSYNIIFREYAFIREVTIVIMLYITKQ